MSESETWQANLLSFCNIFNAKAKVLLETCNAAYKNAPKDADEATRKQNVLACVKEHDLPVHDLRFMLMAALRLNLITVSQRENSGGGWDFKLDVNFDILDKNYRGLAYPIPIFLVAPPLLGHLTDQDAAVIRDAPIECLNFLSEFIYVFIKTINTS